MLTIPEFLDNRHKKVRRLSALKTENKLQNIRNKVCVGVGKRELAQSGDRWRVMVNVIISIRVEFCRLL